MRIKINDKIYRLEEIESGVDSLMELVEEPRYKDGDFVVNMAGDILIFREKVGVSIYDHAYLTNYLRLFIRPGLASTTQIERHATEGEKQKMLDEIAKEGKRWNAEKLCVEDIPKCKFKKGDKVRIKHGVSSKTVHGHCPVFQPSMDDFIGKTMTVNRYDDRYGYVICNESDWRFLEDWLEPYVEELKKGDLAIFWDETKGYAIIRFYRTFLDSRHYDIFGNVWKNAIKFESKEQFERLIKGEI